VYLSDFKVGDRVLWWRSRPHCKVQEKVPATVLRIGNDRVVITVTTPDGNQERRAVLADNLELMPKVSHGR
jgi:hypothetical protein